MMHYRMRVGAFRLHTKQSESSFLSMINIIPENLKNIGSGKIVKKGIQYSESCRYHR